MGRAEYERWLTDEALARIVEWCSEGREDKQIAEIMGISRITLWRWRKEHETLDNAFKSGRECWLATSLPDVVNAAYRLATGYSYDEITQERREVSDGVYELVETKRVTKHQPANPVSNMYWLQNRAPDTWKDRRNVGQEPDDSGETGVVALAEVVEVNPDA